MTSTHCKPTRAKRSINRRTASVDDSLASVGETSYQQVKILLEILLQSVSTRGPSSEPDDNSMHIRAGLDDGKYYVKMQRMTWARTGNAKNKLNQKSDRAVFTLSSKRYLHYAHGESVMNSSLRSSFPFDSHSSFTSAAAACARGLSYLDAVAATTAATAVVTAARAKIKATTSE